MNATLQSLIKKHRQVSVERDAAEPLKLLYYTLLYYIIYYYATWVRVAVEHASIKQHRQVSVECDAAEPRYVAGLRVCESLALNLQGETRQDCVAWTLLVCLWARNVARL